MGADAGGSRRGSAVMSKAWPWAQLCAMAVVACVRVCVVAVGEGNGMAGCTHSTRPGQCAWRDRELQGAREREQLADSGGGGGRG